MRRNDVYCVCVIRYDRTDYSQDMNDRRRWEWKKDLLRTNRVSRCVDVQRGDSHVSCRVQEIIASSLYCNENTHIFYIFAYARNVLLLFCCGRSKETCTVVMGGNA